MGKTLEHIAFPALFRGLLAVFCALLVGGTGLAGTIYITPQDDLTEAIARSHPGDEIVLGEGQYPATDVRIPHDLTLGGEGEVTLFSPVPVAKGLLVPLRGTNVTVRFLTFKGAVSPDKNGAGIRFEGLNLFVEGCTFLENENGILATGDADGALRVTSSTFIRNGHGDGYSHGIYQSSGKIIAIGLSQFSGTRLGHHIKTLAEDVVVNRNRFDDADGRTSYVLDVPAAGNTEFTNNIVLRRRTADQRNLINFSTRRGDHQGSMRIEGNQIVSEKRFVKLLRNSEGLPAEWSDSAIEYVPHLDEGLSSNK